MSTRPLVYIASPFTKGDQGMNVHWQLQTFKELYLTGKVIPIAPLWSMFQHIAIPMGYECWMDIDFALVERVDAVYRGVADLPFVNIKDGETFMDHYREERSSGADRECVHAQTVGVPVFRDTSSLLEWAERFMLNEVS